MADIKLSNLEKDALKEVANIGAGNASSALSSLVKKKVEIVVSDLNFISMDNIASAISGPQQMVVGIYTPITGDMAGTVIIMFPLQSALSLAHVLQKKPGQASSLSDQDKSVMSNMGNILSESYLGSLGKFLGIDIKRDNSKIISTFGESIIDVILLSVSEDCTHGLLIKTNFSIVESKIDGEFVLLLATGKINNVLDKIRDKVK